MESWKKTVLLLYSLLNLAVFIRGFYECRFRKNAYGLAHPLIFLGIIAWGDAVIFCLFWVGASFVSFILNDWYLFLLTISVFWIVRSLGETLYWLNQQFSEISRNPPEKLFLYSIFK